MVYCRAPEQLPHLISFTVADNLGAISQEAFAIINFKSVDNPPMVDLNGDLTPGVNHSTIFTEDGGMIPVRYFVLIFKATSHFYRLLVPKHLSLMLIQKNSLS